MSNPAHSPDGHDGHGHGHGHGGGDHVPHVLPLSAYFAVWGALVVFTIITVIASRIDFGDGNLIIAMLIATTKASLVGLVFMHLLWDHKFHSMILLSSIIFLGIFIGFTSTDTFRRGLADSIEARRPANMSEPFAGMKPLESGTHHHGKAAHAEHGAVPAGEHGAEHGAAPAGEHGAVPAGEHGAAPAVEHGAAPSGEPAPSH